MMAWLTVWWVWVGFALLLGIVEILVPSFFFLGFSIGALVLAAMLGFTPAVLAGLSASALIAVFAGLSLVAWLALRYFFRRQSSGARIFTKDIND